MNDFLNSFGKSWFYAFDPICENHRCWLCFGVFLRIFKITIFVNFMFCALVFECVGEIMFLYMRPDERKPSILLVFWCIFRIFKITIFVKSMFCDLFCLGGGESWIDECDPMCGNHRFCLRFSCISQNSQNHYFMKFIFCNSLFGCCFFIRGGWVHRGVASCVSMNGATTALLYTCARHPQVATTWAVEQPLFVDLPIIHNSEAISSGLVV